MHKYRMLLAKLSSQIFGGGEKYGDKKNPPQPMAAADNLGKQKLLPYALCLLPYFLNFVLIRYSAICTAFRAAPLRIWSPTHQKVIPLGLAMSARMRPTDTLS